MPTRYQRSYASRCGIEAAVTTASRFAGSRVARRKCYFSKGLRNAATWPQVSGEAPSEIAKPQGSCENLSTAGNFIFFPRRQEFIFPAHNPRFVLMITDGIPMRLAEVIVPVLEPDDG
jgi:hypothetical protein